jgi:hypothetical protein
MQSDTSTLLAERVLVSGSGALDEMQKHARTYELAVCLRSQCCVDRSDEHISSEHEHVRAVPGYREKAALPMNIC